MLSDESEKNRAGFIGAGAMGFRLPAEAAVPEGAGPGTHWNDWPNSLVFEEVALLIRPWRPGKLLMCSYAPADAIPARLMLFPVVGMSCCCGTGVVQSLWGGCADGCGKRAARAPGKTSMGCSVTASAPLSTSRSALALGSRAAGPPNCG